MPLYDFRTDDGETVTIRESIHNDIPGQIEVYGKVFKRVFTVPAVKYTGSGFYTTDNADSITKWQRENLQDM